MASTYNILDIMRMHTQLAVPRREGSGVLPLSSSEHERAPTLLPLASYGSMLPNNSGLKASLTSRTCGGGEPCQGSSDALRRTLPVIATSQGDPAAPHEHPTSAQVVNVSRDQELACAPQYTKELHLPGGANRSGAVAPTPAHQLTGQGWPNSSCTNNSTSGGDRLRPFGSTGMLRGWSVVPSGPTQLPTSSQMDPAHGPATGSDAVAPHLNPSSSYITSVENAAGPSSIMGRRSLDGRSSLEAYRGSTQSRAAMQQQLQQCPSQQQDQMATHDGLALINQHLSAAHLLGTINWQQQQISRPQATGSSVASQNLQYTHQLEGRGTLQQQEVLTAQLLISQTQMQGNFNVGELQAHFNVPDLAAGMHRQLEPQVQMAARMQPPSSTTSLQQFRQEHQQQHKAPVHQAGIGGQAVTAFESQQYSRSFMLSCLVPNMRQPAGAPNSSYQAYASLEQPSSTLQQSANMQIQSNEGLRPPPGPNDCTNGAFVNTCKQHLPMCAGQDQQQMGPQAQTALQSLHIQLGLQPHVGQQVGPLDAQASVMRPGLQAVQMQPGLQVTPLQQSQQIQPVDQAIGSQAGSQFPEASNNCLSRQEPVRSQQPWYQQLEQTHYAANANDHGRPWDKQPQSDLAHRRMQLEQQQFLESQHPQKQTQTSTISMSHQQQQILYQRQQSQLFLQQQQQQHQDQPRQEEQRQLQPFMMMESHPGWQQTQPCVQPVTTTSWTPYQYSTGGADPSLVAATKQRHQEQQLLRETEQTLGQRLQGGQCTQGNVGGLDGIQDAEAKKLGQGPEQNILQSYVQGQIQQLLQQHQVQWQAELQKKQQQAAQQQQYAHHQDQPASSHNDNGYRLCTAEVQQNRAPSVGGASLLQGSSLGFSKAPSSAGPMQHGVQAPTILANVQEAMQGEMCMPGAPLPTSSCQQSSACHASGAPQSLLPSAPANQLPQASTVAVSSGNSSLQQLQQHTQQPWVATVSPTQQPQMSVSAHTMEERQRNGDSMIASGNMLRSNELNGCALDPQSLQRPQPLQHQRLQQKQQDARGGNPSHTAQYITQCRRQTDTRIQPPILDCQPGHQHQLSGQDSCATPDGAGQEEVEAVARGASNPFPHTSVAVHTAVPGSVRTGAAALPCRVDALQQPPQQQTQSGVCISSTTCAKGQPQHGPGALQQEPQQQLLYGKKQLQEFNLLQRGDQDVSLHNCQNTQGNDQRQVWMQQQQPKPCQTTLASRLPSELLQGRPLLPLFKPAQDNGGPRAEHAQPQQQQHQQMLLSDFGACASSPAINMPEQHLMDSCMVDHISKAVTGTQINVVQNAQFYLSQQRQEQQLQQQQQEAQQQQQMIQYQQKLQLQPMLMRSAPQSVVAAARPAEVRAAVPAASAKEGFNIYVDSPLLATDKGRLLASQGHQMRQLQQQQQQRHQDHKLPAHLSLNMQCTTQSAQRGMFSYPAGVSPQWALQGAPFSCPGGGNGLAEANATTDATMPGEMRQPALEQVSADMPSGGHVANGQSLGMQLPQQQRSLLQEHWQRSQGHVIPGQEHMAPRLQSALLQLQPPAPLQQQQQQQWQHLKIHHQQQQQRLQLQQQLQASATANFPGTAPAFERRSWVSMPNAASDASGTPASSAAGGPAPNPLASGQSVAQFMTAAYAPTAVPAMNGTSAPITGPLAGCGGTAGGQGSSGSCVAGVERPCKRMKRESDNCAATLQPCTMAVPATPWLGETAGAVPLSDENKAAVAAAMEAVDRLIGPLPVRRTSAEWAPPLVLCPVPGYESSSETKPEPVRKATVPRSPYGESQAPQQHQQHPQLALLEQQHHLRLQQLLGQRRRQSHITGRRSQGSGGGGHMAVAAAPSSLPALPPLPPQTQLPPRPFAHAAPPAPEAVHVVSHGRQWSLEEASTGTPQATSIALGVTPPPAPLRRQLQLLPRKAVTTADDSCARARPIDLSKLGQHRLKPPPVIHPQRPGSRFPLVAAGLRGGAVGVLGSVAPGASPPVVGAVVEDTASGGAVVPDGAVATALGANGRRKRLAVKDRKVPVELLPIVGKAMGAGAGGVRLKRGKAGGHGSGDGQSTAPGKLLNALREAKALLSRRFVVRRSSIAQLGVFAAERIPADTLLMEYHGEAVRNTVADLREKRYAAAGLGCYLFNPGGPPDEAVVLDATHRGNVMRFVNHSCGPNCTAKTVVIEGQRRIFLFSSTVLLPGTELTYDYKLSSALCMDAFKGLPEEYIEQAAEQIGVELLRCQCGDKRCRKYL